MCAQLKDKHSSAYITVNNINRQDVKIEATEISFRSILFIYKKRHFEFQGMQYCGIVDSVPIGFH